MTNPDTPIAPVDNEGYESKGLTIREHFAIELMKSLMLSDSSNGLSWDRIADDATCAADALVERLNRPSKNSR